MTFENYILLLQIPTFCSVNLGILHLLYVFTIYWMNDELKLRHFEMEAFAH